ncbi:hypothetical protein N4T36_04400 [Acinetobacter baumannii]|uniref:hypothetical protein n=1 Tax=Acinetobacter baumannii TaxID=470 RepID=UPI0002BB1E54|nr:hypothetical protein [Acinetobacter baumannii]ANC36073.1 hypothetical protein Aba3207_05300 [Acinetobacter baumannii]AXX42687.1 hypothetical protein Aba9201_17675 [Acinetobacter baumannii]AXX43194.1 hypothetical protein Aba9201_20450 [Acinetobacter baumannii]EKT8003307.1 hypothetical protein [Acinetobacter baumannii]EKU1732698.1 hypothetical protein [Acinetobacter baumannii]
MDKPMTFNEWLDTQGNMVLLHANCCRIAYEAGQQSQQAKVEELQTLYTQQGINMLKMQKRVDSLEKAEFKLAQVKAILQNNPKLLESILVKKLEQALKGEGQ